MKQYAQYVPLVVFLLGMPFLAHAVLPPDVIFSVGTQIYGLIAGVSVVIFGSILTIIPFVKGFFEKLRSFRGAVVFVSVFFFFILSASFFYFSLYKKTSVLPAHPVVGTGTTTVASTSGYRFFSDRFVIVGKDDEGKPLLIDISSNRKENPDGTFIHYYMADILDQEKTQRFYEERIVSGSAVLSDLFFSHFKKIKAVDHSARDSYSFDFSLLGKRYTITTEPLISDFITKNEPEYTIYESAGRATLSVDGKIYAVSLMHQASYSTDYRPSVFFPGSATLPSESTQLVLWDEAHNFYVVDRSNVHGSSSAYASHLWALTKDASGKTKKAFEGNVSKEIQNGTVHFSVSLPDFAHTTMTLSLTHHYQDRAEEGYAEGEITDDQGTRRMYGEGYFHVYGT